MILNEGKEGWTYLAVNKLSKKYQNILVLFVASVVVIILEQRTNLNFMKQYMKIKIFMEL